MFSCGASCPVQYTVNLLSCDLYCNSVVQDVFILRVA